MPTTNPRVNVTLSPSLDALVRRLAAHQRASKSQVLRELLEAAEPALQRAVALMDAASKASAEVRSGLARGLEQTVIRAEDEAAVLLSRMDRAAADLVDQAQVVRGRRPARRVAQATPARGSGPAPGAGNPPASNRGVKSVGTAPRTGAHPKGVTRSKGSKS